MDEKIRANEVLSNEELDKVSGGNIVQVFSMLSVLNNIGVPGIPENLRLEGKSTGDYIQAASKLEEVLESYGVIFNAATAVLDTSLNNSYSIKNDNGSYSKVDAAAVIEHVKAQIVAKTTVSF